MTPASQPAALVDSVAAEAAHGNPAAAAAAPSLPHTGQLWRSDIDGLRALAIGPVVIFHLAQSFMPGGFVGVDVFFVISGYLISRNIFSLSAAGRFSVLDFYERRLRRIFPAYALVLAVVLAVSLMHELPPDAARSGTALLAALGSLTNVYFWATADYFAQPAEKLPLLHSWSLSVEEQFYLLLPGFVVLLGGMASRWLRPAILALFLVSFAISVPGAFLYPTATFYLLPARAWELLLGSILALGLVPAARTRLTREIAAGAGLAAIALSMVLLSPYVPFPGLAALPPCLGAALILHAGESGASRVGRVLSWRPFVFLGAISYSLYLWHWPLLALHRMQALPLPVESKLAERGLLLALSLILATLSWWLVERPTRDRTLVPTRALVIGSAVVAAGLGAAALALVVTHGLPGRFAPPVVQVARFLDYNERAELRLGQCFLNRPQPFTVFDQAACLPNRPDRPNYLLLGDSHAAHLYRGLHAVLPDANILQVTGVECAPLVVAQPRRGKACGDLIRLATVTLPAERPIAKVILSSAWNSSRLAASPGWSPDWLADLKQTVEAFREKGIEAVIVGPNPEYRQPLPAVMARALQKGDPGLVQAELVPDPSELDRRMAAFAAENGLTYISLIQLLCPGGKCRTEAEPGVPMLFDDSHFTAEGSRIVAAAIAKALR